MQGRAEFATTAPAGGHLQFARAPAGARGARGGTAVVLGVDRRPVGGGSATSTAVAAGRGRGAGGATPSTAATVLGATASSTAAAVLGAGTKPAQCHGTLQAGSIARCPGPADATALDDVEFWDPEKADAAICRATTENAHIPAMTPVALCPGKWAPAPYTTFHDELEARVRQIHGASSASTGAAHAAGAGDSQGGCSVTLPVEFDLSRAIISTVPPSSAQGGQGKFPVAELRTAGWDVDPLYRPINPLVNKAQVESGLGEYVYTGVGIGGKFDGGAYGIPAVAAKLGTGWNACMSTAHTSFPCCSMAFRDTTAHAGTGRALAAKVTDPAHLKPYLQVPTGPALGNIGKFLGSEATPAVQHTVVMANMLYGDATLENSKTCPGATGGKNGQAMGPQHASICTAEMLSRAGVCAKWTYWDNDANVYAGDPSTAYKKAIAEEPKWHRNSDAGGYDYPGGVAKNTAFMRTFPVDIRDKGCGTGPYIAIMIEAAFSGGATAPTRDPGASAFVGYISHDPKLQDMRDGWGAESECAQATCPASGDPCKGVGATNSTHLPDFGANPLFVYAPLLRRIDIGAGTGDQRVPRPPMAMRYTPSAGPLCPFDLTSTLVQTRMPYIASLLTSPATAMGSTALSIIPKASTSNDAGAGAACAAASASSDATSLVKDVPWLRDLFLGLFYETRIERDGGGRRVRVTSAAVVDGSGASDLQGLLATALLGTTAVDAQNNATAVTRVAPRHVGVIAQGASGADLVPSASALLAGHPLSDCAMLSMPFGAVSHVDRLAYAQLAREIGGSIASLRCMAPVCVAPDSAKPVIRAAARRQCSVSTSICRSDLVLRDDDIGGNEVVRRNVAMNCGRMTDPDPAAPTPPA